MAKQLVNGVASTIKNLRKSSNISQEELADKAGLDRTYISGVERGVRNITLESLESIIYALEISLPAFLDELKSNLGPIKNKDK
ncbi:MAG: helix-turn-helix transcriptional regulator [Thermoplasmatales archaeon]|nr:helix-turn-helix transcriptional regulator [Thermoplasmatales archaeon]